MGGPPLLEALHPLERKMLPRLRHRLFPWNELSVLSYQQGKETVVAVEFLLKSRE